jgi:hypothetical protein
METYDLSKLTAADFNAYLDHTMDVHFSPTAIATSKVVKVTELDNYSPLERGAFSIVLETVDDKNYRPQGIYTVDHPVVKKLELFLVPIGPSQNGMRYEAVFS